MSAPLTNIEVFPSPCFSCEDILLLGFFRLECQPIGKFLFILKYIFEMLSSPLTNPFMPNVNLARVLGTANSSLGTALTRTDGSITAV